MAPPTPPEPQPAEPERQQVVIMASSFAEAAFKQGYNQALREVAEAFNAELTAGVAITEQRAIAVIRTLALKIGPLP